LHLAAARDSFRHSFADFAATPFSQLGASWLPPPDDYFRHYRYFRAGFSAFAIMPLRRLAISRH